MSISFDDPEQAADHIKRSVDDTGQPYPSFTVEVSQDPERRIRELSAGAATVKHLTFDLPDHQSALDTKDLLIDSGFAGRPGGGDRDSIYILVHRSEGSTPPSTKRRSSPASGAKYPATPASDLMPKKDADKFKDRNR